MKKAISRILTGEVTYAYRILLLVSSFIISATPFHKVQADPFKFTSDRNAPVPIKGRIIDHSGQPVQGANVSVKGEQTVTSTDAQGYFEVIVPEKKAVIIISSVGFAQQEISVNGRNEFNIRLEPLQNALNEVVVVGYGVQNKKNLVGAVSKIDAAQTREFPVASFDAQLQGRAPGVQVNSNAGIPGDGIFVRVRGTTSINSGSDPLYIIDGVLVNNESLQTISTGGRATSALADINPTDIESIEVLKDATATSIYGARGANGVVLITTKRGTYNSRTRIKAHVSQGWVQAEKSKLWKLANGPEGATLINESWINSGIDNPALNQTFANRPFRPASEGGRGLPEEQGTYDRLSDVLRKGRLQNYDLSLEGGTNTTKYYLGGSYSLQESIMRPSDFSRISLKANLDHKVNEKVQVSLSNSISRSYRNQARAGDGPTGGTLRSAINAATYIPKFDDNGIPLPLGDDNVTVLLANLDVQTISLRYLGNIHADAEILPGLKFRTSFSLDYNNYEESEYWNSFTRLGAAPTNGLATSSISQRSTWLNEQTLSYRKVFNKLHAFGVLVGNAVQSDIFKRTAAEGRGFANNSFTLISSASTVTSSQQWTKSILASFFSRVDYNFDQKYFIEFNIRADGSSKFGTQNRWGYFPSIGAAWHIKEENFLKGVDYLSDLKLRFSYGITGNQNAIADFASRGTWTGGAGYPDVPGADQPGIAPEQLGNPALKWEKTQQSNLGIDAGLLDNKINISLNFYRKYTTDLLLNLPVQGITGFSSYWANEGEISNQGYELGINTTNVSNKNFTWTTTFNISGNRNRIEKLPIPITAYTRDWVRMQEGYPMFSFSVYHQLYVDPQTGAPVFEDVDKNGDITADDRVILGNATPKFFGGFSNSFRFYGFDAGITFTYQYGNKSLVLYRMFRERATINLGIFANLLSRWQKPGDITDVPRLTTVGDNYNIEQNSRFLEDASFVRLQSLTFGYTVPKKLTQQLKLENVRVYFVGTNLKLWSKFSGPDPESSVSSDPNIQGLNHSTPPQPQGFQFGINVTL